MDWARDLPSWPFCDHSHQIRQGPHLWHVQELGEGPLILMLHGAGASTHSWHGLMPLLAGDHRLVALDLPGHGFTRLGRRNRSGLVAMSEDIAALLAAEGWTPTALVGHSAGAAVALDLASRLPGPPKVIGINAALARFPGVAGWLFPMLAKMLALNPFTPWFFTLGGAPETRARRLLESTGSQVSPENVALYARLISDRSHVDGALQMMAQWEIDDLLDRLPQIAARCLLLAGERDQAVAPSVSERAAVALPDAQLRRLDGLGHLAHEEDPARVAAEIRAFLSA